MLSIQRSNLLGSAHRSRQRALQATCCRASTDLRQLLVATAGIQNRDVDRLLCLNPELQGQVHRDAAAVVEELGRLGLGGEEMLKVYLRNPLVLATSQEQVLEVLEFMKEDLGFGPTDSRSLVVRFPHVLSYGVKAHLRPHLAFLKSLGETDLPDLVRKRPAVLGEGIESVVKFLQLCRVPRKDVYRMLRTYPMDFNLQLRVSSASLAELSPKQDEQEGGEDQGKGAEGAQE